MSDTQGVERITEKGFIANGKEYEVDCLIFASGFEVTSDLNRRWGIRRDPARTTVRSTTTGPTGRRPSWRDDARISEPVLHRLHPGRPQRFGREQFGKQGDHIAYVISQALKRGATMVEPSQAAQDDYVDKFDELEIDMSDFQQFCPPSYFNNEGEEKPKWALFRGYGAGWVAFQKLLRIGANRVISRASC